MDIVFNIKKYFGTLYDPSKSTVQKNCNQIQKK